MTTRKRLSVAAPWTILAALLLVGIVSGTILRHTIQAPPALVAGPVIAARAPWSRFAAMPIFVFWLLIMFLIRVYLPGVASVLNGHFTFAEVNSPSRSCCSRRSRSARRGSAGSPVSGGAEREGGGD